MHQGELREYLIRYLLDENKAYPNTPVPSGAAEQKRVLRALMNVRPPAEAAADFLKAQDAYLAEAAKEKGVVRLSQLRPASADLYLWQGDITRLATDAIVNAANSGMTGCYVPNHACIDNCIHTYAGVQLRLVCADIIKEQGHEELAGQAKITPAFNLPSRYVIHTVGPIVGDSPTEQDCKQLASCYRSCLTLAEEYGCGSIAFCCIATGVFRFPNEKAAKIALETVHQYKRKTQSKIKVVFNVFKDEDVSIYSRLLGGNGTA